MKLRMSENSLFAILLRSPWWISFVAAIVLTLLALAVLPAQLAPFASAAGLPLVVVGSIAWWRQSKLPSKARVENVLGTVRAMSAREFAQLVEQAFRLRGYEVSPVTGSQAADFELQRDHEHVLLACRRWKAASHGVDPLRDLQALRETREARASTYLALGNVSDAAQRYAREHRIELIQDVALVQLLDPALPRR